MPFVYPDRPHARKHGPDGYRDYKKFKPWLRDDFQFRCVYCLQRERWYPSGHAAFGVDHVLPKSAPENRARIGDYANLVYACNRCNSAKREQLLLDPCEAALADHVRVSDDGTIAGLTRQGRRLVRLLGLNKAKPRKTRLQYLAFGGYIKNTLKTRTCALFTLKTSPTPTTCQIWMLSNRKGTHARPALTTPFSANVPKGACRKPIEGSGFVHFSANPFVIRGHFGQNRDIRFPFQETPR